MAGRAGLLAVTSGVLSSLAVVLPAAASPTAGTAQITVPGQLTPLRSGGSATPYGVVLPQGASCPGDTAHDGYHVFSYLVPGTASPGAISFKTGVPSDWFGYIAAGAYYGAENTAQDTGEIVEMPTAFTWSRLTPEDLFQGPKTIATWEGGIACANVHGVVTNYWNTQIVFKKSRSDPGGFVWSVDTAVAGSGHEGQWYLGGALLGVALVLMGAVVVTRRRAASGEGRGPH